MICAAAIGVAGCSAETTRFGDNSYTGSYAPQQPANHVASAPIQAPPPPPPVERRALPPTSHAPETTGTVSAPVGHWDWAGGTAVIVGPGETIESIARAHHVPARAIIDANGITNPATIRPGQRLVVPHYVPANPVAKVADAAAPRTPVAPHASALQPIAAAPHAAPPPAPHVASLSPPVDASLPASAPAGAGQTMLPPPAVHTVASGDTLSRIAHKYHVKLKDLAVANGMAPETPLKIGMRIAVPSKPIAVPKSAAVPLKGQQGAALPAVGKGPVAAAKTPAQGKMAANEPGARVQVVQPADAPAEEASAAPANGAPEFRWPLRGRVIAKTNDGIDLAVPEGTPVRAADDGVVAYSGNELKGYGNLVLVRHANGFVTAYAHASELLVKRNDQVHKGQVIAKSGQTGTVTSPQLHFEIRKNSSPVDPMQYLPADKTASAPL